MKNKLFIVEGLPCSGKSTTANYLSEYLLKKTKDVLYYDEGTVGHPADYEFHAFMPKNDMHILTNKQQEKIKAIRVKVNDGFVIPLAEVHDDQDLFSKLIPYKIYDCLPWETEMPIMLYHWGEFAQQASKEDTIYVFNCCFLQNPLCEMMMRFNFSYEVIIGYIQHIYECIKCLNPVVVYLKTDNPNKRITEVSVQRDKEWLTSVIDYHTSQGYGKENQLVGFDGYISCLEKRQAVELSILEQIPIEKIVIANPFENWERTYDEIADYISRLNR
ncbi:MAG: hypothetical protein ACI35O_04460 [Bacillaceae bacterium]